MRLNGIIAGVFLIAAFICIVAIILRGEPR